VLVGDLMPRGLNGARHGAEVSPGCERIGGPAILSRSPEPVSVPSVSPRKKLSSCARSLPARRTSTGAGS
jgi:hypothetical protein